MGADVAPAPARHAAFKRPQDASPSIMFELARNPAAVGKNSLFFSASGGKPMDTRQGGFTAWSCGHPNSPTRQLALITQILLYYRDSECSMRAFSAANMRGLAAVTTPVSACTYSRCFPAISLQPVGRTGAFFCLIRV